MKSQSNLTPSSASGRTTEPPEATPQKHRRVGGRSARIKAAVFKATMDLLLTEGYNTLTIAEIASRSGVHETSIYRRWKTKEALVIEVFIEHAKEVLPMPDTGSLQSDLVQLLHTVIAFLQSPIGNAMIQASTASLHNPAMDSERQHYWSSRFAQFNVLVERAVKRGELPPHTDAQMLLKTLIGPLYVQALLLNQPLDEELPRRIVDLVINGAMSREKT